MANDNFDLPRPTDAVPSSTSTVLNDNSKVLDYVINGEGTVENRTGAELLTLDEAISRINWAYVGLFADGVTFTAKTDFAVDAVGTQWVYNGPYPFVATAGTVPSSPDYQVVHVGSLQALNGIEDPSGLDEVFSRAFDSVSDLKNTTIDVTGVSVKTKSYYAGWAATLGGPTGGATYNLVTKAEHDVVRGVSVVDEYGDHTLANGNVALLGYRGGVRHADKFGASNGIADSFNPIQQAIKSLNEGGQVFLPAGDLNLGFGNTLRDDVLDPASVGKTITLIGVGSSEDQANSGKVTTLHTTGGSVAIRFDGNRSGGRDFAVKGDEGALATAAANIIVESSRAQWKNIVSMNSRGSGLWFRFGNNSSFENISCLGNNYRGFDVDGTGYVTKGGVPRPNDLNASVFTNIDVRANADIGFRTGVNSGFSNFYYNITAQGNGGVGCQINGDYNRIFGFYGEGNGGDLVASTQMLESYFYEIASVGTSDFTLVGAPDNNIGTRFITTGPTAGTGTAIESLDIEFTSTADNNYVWGVFSNDELAGAKFTKDSSANQRNYIDRLKSNSNEINTQLIKWGEAATPNGYIAFDAEGDGTNTAITLEATSSTQQIDITSSGAGQLGINPDFIAREAPTAPTLLNGWVNVGGSRKVAGFYKTKDNIVHLEGVIAGGATTNPTELFVLPVGYRPAGGRIYFSTNSNGAYGGGFIETTGQVYFESGSSVAFSLDSISFRST